VKSTVEHLSPTRVRINVEVPFDELKPNFDRAYRALAKQVRIPGFRPGKAPARVLESRIGRGPVLDEVVNEAVPAKYLEALNGSEVRTLGRPEFNITKVEDGEEIAFTAEVDVRPAITLPDVGELAVTVDDVEISEEDEQRELDQLRARFGTLSGVDRPAQQGDFLSIDLSASVDGEELEEAQTSGFSYEIGSGGLIEGIDDALIGLREGESATFTTQLAGEYAGRDAEVSVTVNSVKERELPEPDDEFAQLASEFDTLDELTADLRKNLLNVKRMEQGMQARDKVVDALLEVVDVPLPEGVVESEVQSRLHNAVHPFDHDEERFGQWLEQQGKTREEFETETRQEAEKAVRVQLLMDTVADQDQISVSDEELSQQIVYHAQSLGVRPEEFVQQAQSSGQLGAIYADVRRSKALLSVVQRAQVVDSSGNVVDLGEVFGAQEQAEPESEEEPPAEDTGQE
jgi:trigger factor